MFRRQSQRPGAEYASPAASPVLGRVLEHGTGESVHARAAQASSSSFSPRTLHASQFEPSTILDADQGGRKDLKRPSVHWNVTQSAQTNAHRRRSTAGVGISHDGRSLGFIDGAERLAIDTPTTYDEEACSYTFDVKLNNPGLFWVNMTLVHEDFDGVREIDATPQSRPQPRLVMTPLVQEPVAFDICSSDCRPFVPALSNSDAQAVVPAQKPVGSSSFKSQTTPCTARSTFTGSYVPSNPISVLYPPLPIPFSVNGRASSTRSTAGFYKFVPDTCTWLHSGSKHEAIGDVYMGPILEDKADLLEIRRF
ncbi:hypothetical protein OIV83_004199 [Microbotryomycetes sp. JL201]|nr:hypothetical protein OIV83_004199 [Microbotryomycetes sp. JL201]